VRAARAKRDHDIGALRERVRELEAQVPAQPAGVPVR
jgi:hypothetical protein